MSLPVTRPVGRALLVAHPEGRGQPLETLNRLGFACSESDDPYHAMAELSRRPLTYRALVLSLAGLYREELPLIDAVKRRFPHVDIWLIHTDGRHAALAEAMRLGADGLVADDGLHRIAFSLPAAASAAPTPALPEPPRRVEASADRGEVEDGHESKLDDERRSDGEPLLTADELRALLQEQPSATDLDEV